VAGSISAVAPLAHDPLQPKLAGVLKHPLSVAVEVLREPDAVWLGQELAQHIPPMVELLMPDVEAIDRQDIEAVKEHAGVMLARVQEDRSNLSLM
jgi:hypothetical protein